MTSVPFPHFPAMSLTEFRDFTLLMLREAPPREIHQHYDARKPMGDVKRGVGRLTSEGVLLAGLCRLDD